MRGDVRRMKVYIAGGMRSWVGCLLAKYLRADGHEVLDPNDWAESNPTAMQYTQADLAAIRKSDVVVAFMSSDNPSGYGMSLEVGFAHGIGKPVLFLDKISGDWRSKYFDMVRSVAHDFVETTSDVRDVLRKFDL